MHVVLCYGGKTRSNGDNYTNSLPLHSKLQETLKGQRNRRPIGLSDAISTHCWTVQTWFRQSTSSTKPQEIMNLLSYITLVHQLVFTANMSRLQVIFALSAVQGLCVTTVDRNLYPLCLSARHDSTSIWIPPGAQQGVQNEQGALLPKQSVRGWRGSLSGLPFSKHF